jgi:Hypoxia induced protein conserved region
MEASFGYYSAKSQCSGVDAPAMADRQSRCYVKPMASFLSTFVLPIAIAAVALVLLLGLINMMRGGSPGRSQKLMRLRVLLQFVAIVIIMITVWAMGHR